MPINKAAIQHAVKLVGRDHARFILRLATDQDKMENQWVSKTGDLNKRIVGGILEGLKSTGKILIDDNLVVEFLISHYVQVVGAAIRSTHAELQVIVPEKRLARPRIPRSMAEIRRIYDEYRRTGKLPKALRDQGNKIKKEYLKKTQSVWRTYSHDFREGDEATQENVLRKVEKAADTVESRAKTIVRTETTNYYNRTRREIYDQSDAITHYLFLAIRDQRTTKWCSEKTVDGKRGRHGLVYAKDDPITNKETPACHWNCRSEMVPLSPFNPRHLRLIKDLSMHRRNNSCHPLPEGWGNVA